VDLNPARVPVYTECLRLCGNWLSETCLESPGVILEKYMERVRGRWTESDVHRSWKVEKGGKTEI